MFKEDGRPSMRHSDAQDVLGLINSSLCSMDYPLGVNQAPWGVKQFCGVCLPNINIFRDEGVGQRNIRRTHRHILADATSDFIISVPLTAHSELHQAGIATTCNPGTFRIHSTALPFFGSVRGEDRLSHFSQMVAKVPGSVMRQLLPNIDNFPNVSITIRPGVGKMMLSMLELALAEGRDLTKEQAASFSKALVDVIVSTIANSPETGALVSVDNQSPHGRIRSTAMAFIARNLSNPSLDVTMVASHCQVSERYLHTAFASSSLKVATYIRGARLEQCRLALQNPSLRCRSITEIALTWGFDDPTSFSRTYKAWHGKTPREERDVRG